LVSTEVVFTAGLRGRARRRRRRKRREKKKKGVRVEMRGMVKER
jgi:hypothetical protein